MTLKICHNNQIHRISKLPSDYASLIKTVSLLFENQLPPQWTLQYIDSDGDHVMLSDEHDFANLVEDGLLSSTKAVKVFILPLNEGQNPSHSQILVHGPPKVASIVSQQTNSEDFQFLEKPEEQNSIKSLPQEEEENTNYQEVDPSEEQKPLLADESARFDEQPHPETSRQRSRSQRKVKPRKIKKVMKKLARESLSPEKRTKLEEKMRKMEESLTPEQREEFNKKKEKIAKRQAEKQAKRKAALKDAVTDIIYEHLPTIASLAKDLIQEERPQEESKPQTKVVHARVECDGCGEGPIVGVRYKCSVCPDFDYCERCESRIEHPHPFIKLKTPNQDIFMSGPRGFCGGRGGCRRQRSPKHCPMKGFQEKLNEFKQSDSFKNIVSSLFTGARPSKEDEEKAQKDVQQLYSTLPQNTQEKITSHYNNLPQELKININKFLGGLPEQVINKQQEKEEVKIEEETLIKATEPVQLNEPLIQEVEIKVEVEDKKPEPEPVIQKEFNPEIKAKAQSLKDIFEEADINNLLEFVSQTPEMSLEELVENYLSL